MSEAMAVLAGVFVAGGVYLLLSGAGARVPFGIAVLGTGGVLALLAGGGELGHALASAAIVAGLGLACLFAVLARRGAPPMDADAPETRHPPLSY